MDKRLHLLTALGALTLGAAITTAPSIAAKFFKVALRALQFLTEKLKQIARAKRLSTMDAQKCLRSFSKNMLRKRKTPLAQLSPQQRSEDRPGMVMQIPSRQVVTGPLAATEFATLKRMS